MYTEHSMWKTDSMKLRDIAIIIPPDDSFREINSAIPSLGAATLSGYLKSHGYAHGIYDLARRGWIEPEISAAIRPFGDRARVLRYLGGGSDDEIDRSVETLLRDTPVSDGMIFGFSMDIMPRYTKLGSMLCMARWLKKRVDCATVAGGLLYAEGMAELLGYESVDFAISSLDVYSYSGHRAFLLFLEELKKKKPDFGSVPGLVFRDGGKVRSNPSSDAEPFFPPDFSAFNLDMYRTSIPPQYEGVCEGGLLVLPYRFAAGCKCNCAYCYNSRFRENTRLETDETIEQLAAIKAATGCRHFLFLNPCFNVTKKFSLEMADALKGSGLGIKWSDCAMFQGMDAEVIPRLAEAGCARLFFGFESLTSNIDRYVTKKLDLPSIVKTLEICGDNNIWTGLDIITGFPYETRPEMRKLASFLRKYSSLIDSVTINKFMLYRHTKFYTEAEKFGIAPGEAGSMLEAAGGAPFDEVRGRKWAQIKEDTEWGALQLRQALEGSLGYWNDAEMLPILFGLLEKCDDKKTVRARYREMIEAYPRRRDEEEKETTNEKRDDECAREEQMGALGDQKDFARDIKITVKSMKGLGCRGNHYVGQTFYIVDSLAPGRICLNALTAMMPSVSVLMFAGKMPWGQVETLDVACPDGTTQVIFELSVIKPEDAEKEKENLLKTQAKRAGKIGAGKFQKGRH